MTYIDQPTGYLNINDIAIHFGGASRSWIEKQVKAGTIPAPTKIAGRNLWHRSTLANYDAAFIAAQATVAG